MKRPEFSEADNKKVEATAAFLRSEFPEIGPDQAHLHAQSLVEAPRWSDEIYHRGTPDLKTLRSFRSSLARASSAGDRMSTWVWQGIETAMHQIAMGERRREDMVGVPWPPLTREEILATLECLVGAAARAEDMHASWRATHGKNTPAVLLIAEARRVWTVLSGVQPPPKALNLDTKFARFLEGIFDRVDVHMNLQKAYSSWFDLASDPDSPLYERPQQ